MSRSSDSKLQVGDSNITTATGKIKVKTGGKKEKNVEQIMQDFLEEKDKEKWHYFVDKLGKKDSAVLKQLLFIVTPVKTLLFDEVVTLICLLDLMINYLVFLYLIHVKFLFTSYITSTMKYFVFCIPFC